MIQPNELRIGNIVSLKNGYNTELPKYGKVTQVYMNGFTVDYHWPDEWFEPVELTPDILEAAGWYWNNEADCYEHSDVRMSMNHNSISGWTMFNYVLKAKITNKIFYLHQLQNLYFALTGEELQIDITKLNKEK